MAYAEIERIGRELNSMFYTYAYAYGQDVHHHHHYDESTSSSGSSLVDEMAMNMESLSVSAMDDLDWSEELPTSSSSSSSTLPSSHPYYANKSPTSMADESCSKSFYFEDWATRLIGTPPTEMDLDGMKCSAVENSPQQPCKALR